MENAGTEWLPGGHKSEKGIVRVDKHEGYARTKLNARKVTE